jgi:hypothetical protein
MGAPGNPARIGRHAQPRHRIAEHVRELAVAELGIERYRHKTRGSVRDQRDERLERGLCPHADAIAWREPSLAEPGEVICACRCELALAQRAPAKVQRWAI